MSAFITLPDVHDIERKVRAGKSTELTELEYFVLMHEPTKWPDCRVFREQLQAALEEIVNNNAVDSNWNSAGNCRHGVSLSLHCARYSEPTDSQRLDWMERHLQRPTQLEAEDGTVRNVGSCWVLASPSGLTLRETVDAAVKGEK